MPAKGRHTEELVSPFSSTELEAKISNIVEKTISLHMEKFRKTIEDKLDHITSVLESRIFNLEKSNDVLKQRCDKAESNIVGLQDQIQQLRCQANEVEQYSRRNCFNVNGCPAQIFPKVGPNNSPPDHKSAAATFLNEKLGTKVTAGDIDAAHPLGPPKNNKINIVIKFHQRETRDSLIKMRRKLAGSGTVIQENLTKDNVKLLKDLRDDKYKNVIESSWSWSGKIWIKLKNGPTKQVRLTDVISDLVKSK